MFQYLAIREASIGIDLIKGVTGTFCCPTVAFPFGLHPAKCAAWRRSGEFGLKRTLSDSYGSHCLLELAGTSRVFFSSPGSDLETLWSHAALVSALSRRVTCRARVSTIGSLRGAGGCVRSNQQQKCQKHFLQRQRRLGMKTISSCSSWLTLRKHLQVSQTCFLSLCSRRIGNRFLLRHGNYTKSLHFSSISINACLYRFLYLCTYTTLPIQSTYRSFCVSIVQPFSTNVL